MILRISVLSSVTISGGVLAGATKPAQASMSKPVTPGLVQGRQLRDSSALRLMPRDGERAQRAGL